MQVTKQNRDLGPCERLLELANLLANGARRLRSLAMSKDSSAKSLEIGNPMA